MKVGIIGAMEQEVALLRSQLSGTHHPATGRLRVPSGRLAGKR